ncbi:hypothetical protein IFO69_02650 [Echinicola sp. CAU 1574]|uniref:Uncharacterized protein n=1 Tax=Echinicola arenosa TaxID=2774144 RepID=A0ABR9AJ49_9BACT|nr:hypothetical protein [Echinicola arenosa]MBD8487639.1 hypothetical protein [Echinicola arenosa]
MIFFYLSNCFDKNGVHEVHKLGCAEIHGMDDASYLGPFNNGAEALRKARLNYENVSLCVHCCPKKVNDVLEKQVEPK